MSVYSKPENDSLRQNLKLVNSQRNSNIIESRYNLIYLQSNLGIVYYNSNKIIIDCNDKFLDIVGFRKEELLGLNIFDIFESNDVLPSIRRAFNKLSSSFEGDYYNSSRKIKLSIRGHFLNETSQDDISSVSAGIIEDITLSKKTENEFKLLSYFFNNLNECVVVTDPDNMINFVNEGFLNLYGYFESEIVGKEIKILSHLKTSKKIIGEVYKLQNTSDSWQGVLINNKKDGTEFPVHLSSTIIKNSTGKGYYRIGIIRDITEEKKIEKELISAKIKAEQSDKLKSEFLGQMSHEIRTPINIILNISNMILEDHYSDADEDTVSTFAILDSAGKRIIRTIDLILNMSNIQVGAYVPTLKKIDLFAEMYNLLFREYNKLAEEKDLEFRWNKETNKTKIIADYYSVSQIFSNILHNSMQFTHFGEIEVRFTEDKQNNLVVEFIDSGVGISGEFLPRIFESFSQEESGYTRRYEGNGLGLALVKSYCEINNIKINVESKKGFGSTFSLIFQR